MIEKLEIENYALIDKVELGFSNGFTVITGETGSGKSIMLDALGLLLGERADTKAISDSSRKTIIEAVFSNPNEGLKTLFENNDIEWNDRELIIRREIQVSGRSRAFINDTPVNLSLLAEIGRLLIDIHSQNKNSILLSYSNYLSIIDSFARDQKKLNEYKDLYNRYATLRIKIKKEKERIEKNRENRDYITFRLAQLDKINPKEGELQKIEQEYDILSDTDRIREDLGNAYELLEGREPSVITEIARIESYISNINESFFNSEDSETPLQRLQNIRLELKDISETLYDKLEDIDSDPQRLLKVSARMNTLYDAIKNFKVKDEKELVELHESLKKQLSEWDDAPGNLSEWEKEARKIAGELKLKADELSEIRKSASESFSKKLMDTASSLGLPNINFEIELKKSKLNSEGQDTVDFLCSFNKNHDLQPVSKIASGGEMSRLMLSIKSIMADIMEMPTIIFDEIDTGVSGEIADKMGKLMGKMSDRMQVLSITHLPQVAAQGDYHFKVYKTDDTGKTRTLVRFLSPSEREEEIAGMLSGTNVNEAARHNARILIQESKEKNLFS